MGRMINRWGKSKIAKNIVEINDLISHQKVFGILCAHINFWTVTFNFQFFGVSISFMIMYTIQSMYSIKKDLEIYFFFLGKLSRN